MKKGFTLIELLAVIVILAIILVIAVPQILGVIRNSKVGAMESDAKLVLNAIQRKKTLDLSFDPTQYNNNLQGLLNELGISGDNYTSVSFSYNEGVLFINVEGKGKYDGLVACGTYDDMRVSDNECAYNTDITAPEITLNGSSSIEIEQGGTYTESGATAIDDEDGNVSVTVTGTVNTSTIGTYTITYRAEDTSGNVATLIRTINVVVPDTAAPVLTLNGNSSIEIEQGGTYIELGATATDNKDVSVTVNTSGTVDTGTVGTYTITYTSTDSKGNTGTTSRIVSIVLPYYNATKGVNRPVLSQGMTPIKWNGSAWVNTTESDTTWYNYDTTNKIWANAKTADGSMWVWIPRYAYQIATNYHTNTAGTINIKFLQKGTNTAADSSTVVTTPTYSGSAQTNYILHPAFDFGGTQLTGIWVAKFEASAAEGASNGYTADSLCLNSTDNVTTKTIKIVPNVVSWRCLTINNMFLNSRSMETNSTYGWGTTGNNIDTHLIKNIEWGATVYLSRSTYGKNTEFWINNANNYMTGCAGNSVSDAASTTGCVNAYSTTNGLNASTTGNIYGIYDMSGGAWDLPAAYINNGDSNLNTYALSLINANSKYKDVYTVTTDNQATNFSNASGKKGDAIYEITNAADGSSNTWFTDNSWMPFTTAPFFLRGGKFNSAYSGPFAFGSWGIAAGSNGISTVIGFRPVIIVEQGL